VQAPLSPDGFGPSLSFEERGTVHPYLECHFPCTRVSKDGDLEILATQVAPDKIGRSRGISRPVVPVDA
jgi:hypothetical protein